MEYEETESLEETLDRLRSEKKTQRRSKIRRMAVSGILSWIGFMLMWQVDWKIAVGVAAVICGTVIFRTSL